MKSRKMLKKDNWKLFQEHISQTLLNASVILDHTTTPLNLYFDNFIECTKCRSVFCFELYTKEELKASGSYYRTIMIDYICPVCDIYEEGGTQFRALHQIGNSSSVSKDITSWFDKILSLGTLSIVRDDWTYRFSPKTKPCNGDELLIIHQDKILCDDYRISKARKKNK